MISYDKPVRHVLKTHWMTYCGLSRHGGVGLQPHVGWVSQSTCEVCKQAALDDMTPEALEHYLWAIGIAHVSS